MDNPIPIRLAFIREGSAEDSFLVGILRAVTRINAAGGVRGRPIKLENYDARVPPDLRWQSPEWRASRTKVWDAIRAAIDASPHAIAIGSTPEANSSDYIRTMGSFQIPYFSTFYPYYEHWHRDLDVALTAAIRDGRVDYRHVFDIDLPLNVRWLDFGMILYMCERRYSWDAASRKVHLVRGPSEHNAAVTAEVRRLLSSSGFQLSRITDLEYPVRDWISVQRAIREDGPGLVMLDHELGAENTAFPRVTADRDKGGYGYLQYLPVFGPSHPPAIVGFICSTVCDVRRSKQSPRWGIPPFGTDHDPSPVHLGTGGDPGGTSGYALARILGNVWKSVEPEDLVSVADHLCEYVYPQTWLPKAPVMASSVFVC